MKTLIFECPVCGSELEHDRTDNGTTQHRIHKSSIAEETLSKSNGGNHVYCKENDSHELPYELVDAVFDLVE